MIAHTQVRSSHPTIPGEQPVLRSDPDGAATGELDAGHRASADPPHQIGSSRNNALLLVHRPDFRLRANQARDGYLPAIREPDERIACHAFAQVRHHRLLVLTLLDCAIEL